MYNQFDELDIVQNSVNTTDYPTIVTHLSIYCTSLSLSFTGKGKVCASLDAWSQLAISSIQRSSRFNSKRIAVCVRERERERGRVCGRERGGA